MTFPAPNPRHRQPAPRPNRGWEFFGFIGILFSALVLLFAVVQ